MAFTQSPTAQTYSSPKISAVYDIDMRPNSLYTSQAAGVAALSQDSGMVNIIPVKRKDRDRNDDIKLEGVTRHAITGYNVIASSGSMRGVYVWEYTEGTVKIFCVVDDDIYSCSGTGTSMSSWNLENTFTNFLSTPVGFTEFVDSTNTKKLVVTDGREVYVYPTVGAGVKVTDADMPTPHLPFPVFLNGRLYLAKKSTADIYNSNLDDPTAWTAGDFISSELYPDNVQALVKINNYILAIGAQGCEYFYDAANPSGSPLARYEGGSLGFGTVFPYSVAVNKRQVIMIASNNDGEPVLKAIEDFKVTDLEFSQFAGILHDRTRDADLPISYDMVRGYYLRQGGELLYALNMNGWRVTLSSLTLENKTFALHLESKTWVELRAGASGEYAYPVICTSPTIVRNFATTFVGGNYNNRPFVGYIEDRQTAADTFTKTFGSGDSTITPAIYTEIRTPNLDFDTMNMKTMSRMGVEVTTNTSSSSAVNLTVSWSDDDYKTWATDRTMDVSGTTNFPFITQLGAFRQRAFKITYAGDQFLRYKSITFDINKGQQ